MQITWFRGEEGTEFKVPVELTLCFNAQCVKQTKDSNLQAHFENALYDSVRKCCKCAQFVIGIVNAQKLLVDGSMSEDIVCLDKNMGGGSHAVGIIQAERTSVQAWNTCGDSCNVMTLPSRYVLCFITVNITQIEVRKPPAAVECLLESQPEEADWLLQQGLDLGHDVHLFDWLFARGEACYYKDVQNRGTFYSLHPNRGPAEKRVVKKTRKRGGAAGLQPHTKRRK